MVGGPPQIPAPAARALVPARLDGQNVIRDSRSRDRVYLPSEAKDVPRLMADLAHHPLATIHPDYDGKGRTARLLTTRVPHLAG
ncbi:MAG: hypothetical protein ACKOET_03820 [Verrucomicrobiota bacterium]